MKQVLGLVLLLGVLVACNKQTDYSHSPKEFTEFDRNAIARVQRMALGKPDILNSIVDEYSNEDSAEVAPCNYEVRKVVRRDRNQIDGVYPEEIHVICLTSTNEFSFRFEWIFDRHLERISEFKFGFDPVEFDRDE